MKLFIVGATGGIGQHLVQLALGRGHEVTAYVRSPQKIGPGRERLTVVEGDVFAADAMARAMAGHDVVLSAFGPMTMRATTQRRDFGRALAGALRKSGVSRAQVVSAAFLFRGAGLLVDVLRATLFRQMAPDMAAMEEEVCQDDLDWTIVRPPRLTNGLARHNYRVADGKLPKKGAVIARADVASFMIGEAENPSHVRQIVGLAD